MIDRKEKQAHGPAKNNDQLTPLQAVHKAARGFYKAGVISKKRMREYDQLCASDDVANK